MYKYLIGFLAAGIGYKGIFISLDLDFFLYLLSVVPVLLALFKLCLSGKLRRVSILWIVPFIIYCVFSSITLALNHSVIIGIVSFTGLLFYLLVWFFIISVLMGKNEESIVEKYLYLLFLLGVIHAIFAIYQYHFDASLFNLSSHRIFGNRELMESGRFTRRAGSFLGSPQNLGIFLGITFSLLIFFKMKLNYKVILSLLIVYAGFLSGSAAFVAFVFIFNFFWFVHSSRGSIKISIVLVVAVIVIFAALYIQKIENLSNMPIGAVHIADLWTETHKGHTRFELYAKLLKFDGLKTFFFGHGAGLTDRLVEVVGQRFHIGVPDFWVPGSESYMIKLFYEIGLIGLATFILPYLVAIVKSYRSRDRLNQLLFACLIAILVNLLFTPSFTGLTMSFVIWPFILYPLSRKVINHRDTISGISIPRLKII